MAFKSSDPIMGKTRGSVEICYAHAQKIGAKRLPEVKKLIDEYYRLGPIVGIDAYIMYVQAVHETGDFGLGWWNDRLNPAGIGITGDSSQNNASRTWTSGTEAAKSHVAHMLMYTLGRIDRGGLTKANDPRYQAYLDTHGADGIAETVADLENTWGIDDGYAEAMQRRGNEIWSAVPNASSSSSLPVVDAPTSVYATPEKIEGFDGTKDIEVNGKTIYAQKQKVVAQVPVNSRVFAGLTSKLTRAPYNAGNTINVLGWLYGDSSEGENRWWITSDYSRVWAGGTTEKPRAAADDHPATVDCPIVLKKKGVQITSQHGVPNGAPCEWYEYAVEVGLPPCSHPGVDLGVSFVPCYSPVAGTVEFAGPDQYYSPNHVNVRVTEEGPFKGNVLIYGHLSKVSVTKGQTVKAGTLIGTTGEMTPDSGPHLHFEVRNAQEMAINPLPILRVELAPVTDPPVEVPSTEPESTWKPKIIDRWLHVAQLGYGAVERRYIGRYGMTPKIIVVHIQEGFNLGSWQWFHETTASATVEIGMNGDIWRLVPESDAPWTNGDVNNPTAIGREVINKWGADPNVYTLSIENEGESPERHTQAQFDANKASMQKQIASNVWQIKTWMAKYNIPKVYVIRHKDISQNGKPMCPGDAFFKAIIAALDGVNVPVEVVYDSPSRIEGFDGSKDIKIGTALFHADKKKVTASLDTVYRRMYAGQTSAETGKPYKKGESFNVLGWVEGELVGNEKRWWIGEDYSRVWVGGTTEKPTGPAPAESYPDTTPEGVKIVNGVMYYQAFEPNTTVARRFTVRVNDATIRDQPSTKGKALGKVVKGQEVVARWWCFGEEVKGDRIWWLLDSDADPFTDPQYIWGNVSEERPQ